MSIHLSLSLTPHVLAIFFVLDSSPIDLSHCHGSLCYYFSNGLIRANDQMREALDEIGTFHCEDAQNGFPARIIGTWATTEGSVEKVMTILERAGINSSVHSYKTFRIFTWF